MILVAGLPTRWDIKCEPPPPSQKKKNSIRRKNLFNYWFVMNLFNYWFVMYCALQELPGSSVVRALATSLRKPGIWTLPQAYVKAGSKLLVREALQVFVPLLKI